MLFNKKIVMSLLAILALVSFAFTSNPYLSKQKHDNGGKHTTTVFTSSNSHKDPKSILTRTKDPSSDIDTSTSDRDTTTTLDRDSRESTTVRESREGSEVSESSESGEETEEAIDDDDNSSSNTTTVMTLNTILPVEAESDSDGDDMTLSITPQQADSIATQKIGSGSIVNSTSLQGQETNTPFYMVTVMNNGTTTKVDVNATNGNIIQ
jgi:uncharacterized membrane protein YkoI